MNKRGQFFLIAAVIISALIISLATAVNFVNVEDDNEAFYDLADEVKFETKRVLDYGVFNPSQDTLELTRSFLLEYATYISQEQVVFLYGDRDGVIRALAFEEQSGHVGINTGTPVSGTVSVSDLVGREAEIERQNGIVNVKINEVVYDFNLKEGQNFFFVIIKEQDDEKFVAKG